MYDQLRVARPTDNLERIAAMYRDGLGFEIVATFAGHDGFDGVVLGHAQLGYQLEFTTQHGHPAPRDPSPDHLLVFYILDRAEWADACKRLLDAGFQPVPSWNPYWDAHGKTFADADGHRVVLENDRWPAPRGQRETR